MARMGPSPGPPSSSAISSIVPLPAEHLQHSLRTYISMAQSQLIPGGHNESQQNPEVDEANKLPMKALSFSDKEEGPAMRAGGRRRRLGGEIRAKNYQKANFSSVLPEYSLSEQDTIKSAFLPTSFNSISRLPHKLKPDAVRQAKPRHIRRNLASQPHFHTQSRPLNSSGMFVDFRYSPSVFNTLESHKRQEKHEHTQKFQILCRDRFQGPGIGAKLKYEDPCDPNYSYPRLNDPFGEEEARRKRCQLEEQSKIVSGPFRPTGHRHSEVDSYNALALSRKSLLDVIKRLHAVVVRDWAEADFTVAATMDDFLAVVFDVATLDSFQALVSYMDVLVQRHPLCQKYLLAKVKAAWANCHIQEGKIWFVLRPAWVKPNAIPDVLIHGGGTAAAGGRRVRTTGTTSTSVVDGMASRSASGERIESWEEESGITPPKLPPGVGSNMPPRQLPSGHTHTPPQHGLVDPVSELPSAF